LIVLGMLDFHFPRHQERANLHVGRRLRLAHLFNRGRPVLFEVGSEREQKILVERSTGSLEWRVPSLIPVAPGY
jgi:hypothetical protein